jgi:CRISPR-associated endonuclease Csn1
MLAKNQLDKLVDHMPLPWPTFREHVERALNNIIVSHKPEHGYQGSIHEDTAWGIRENGVATRLVKPEDGCERERVTKKQKLVLINSTNDRLRHGQDESGQPKAYKGYVGGSNYCIEVVQDDKGKWAGEVISTYDAYQVVRELGEEKGYQKLRDSRLSQSGKQLVMRLMIGDIVCFPSTEGKQFFRVVKVGANGQVIFAEHFEANADARNRDKENSL